MPGSDLELVGYAPFGGPVTVRTQRGEHAISRELALPCEGTRAQLLDRLNRFLLDASRAGRRVLLLVDEAQNLPIETLEELRLLSNLETTTEKLLQIVLFGQPELDALRDRLFVLERTVADAETDLGQPEARRAQELRRIMEYVLESARECLRTDEHAEEDAVN